MGRLGGCGSSHLPKSFGEPTDQVQPNVSEQKAKKKKTLQTHKWPMQLATPLGSIRITTAATLVALPLESVVINNIPLMKIRLQQKIRHYIKDNKAV